MAEDERASIKQAVMKYITGIRDSRPDMVADAFHPDAVMTRVFGDDVQTSVSCGGRIAEFMRNVPPTSEHSPDFQGRIVNITQHGTMAAVEIAEDQLQGKDMKTFFHLHKTVKGWLIVSKATWAPG